MLKVVAAFFRIELATYLRNRMAMFWTLANPLLTLVLLMTAFGGGGNLAVIKVDLHDLAALEAVSPSLAAAIRTDLGDETYLRVRETKPGNRLESRGDVGIRLAVLKEPDGHWAIDASRLYGEPTHFNVVRTALRAAVERTDASDTPKRISFVGEQAANPPRQGYGEYLTVGVLTITIMSVCLFGFSIPLVELRTSGSAKMYQVFPMRLTDFMTAFIGARLVIVLAVCVILILVASAIYKLSFPLQAPSFWLALVTLCVFASLAFTSIGVLVAGVSPNVATASALVNVVYLPLIFFSDIFIPLSALPESVGAILRNLPVAAFVGGMRAVLIQGEGFGALWPAMVSLGLLALTALAVARLTFTWSAK